MSWVLQTPVFRLRVCHAAAMDPVVDAAATAWARLLGLGALGELQVVVDPTSWLAPRGWIGILAVGPTLTASVPSLDLEERVRMALEELTPAEATTPETVIPRMPFARSAVGPAKLFYPPERFTATNSAADVAMSHELAGFLAEADADDLQESGLGHIESPAFVSRTSDGVFAAVCGYRRWPNAVAHLGVMTHPSLRRHGHGKQAASRAINHATTEGLLPQWRARPLASQRLAGAIGLIAVGTQLVLEPK
jgi:RimJ/RimL family protein N-acetyltransferase